MLCTRLPLPEIQIENRPVRACVHESLGQDQEYPWSAATTHHFPGQYPDFRSSVIKTITENNQS